MKLSVKTPDNRSCHSKEPELDMLEKMSSDNNFKPPDIEMLDKMSAENDSKAPELEMLDKMSSENSKPPDL